MKPHQRIPLTALVGFALVFSACKKEEVDLSTNNTYVVGSSSYTLTSTEGIGGLVLIDSDYTGWLDNELMIQLGFGMHPLQEGDSVIVIAQVGLQLTDASCTQEMHVSSAIIASGSEAMPQWNDEIIEETWSGTDLIKQFTRTRTMRVGSVIPSVVKVFMKPWSVPCSNGARGCLIFNRSLTVIVIPG